MARSAARLKMGYYPLPESEGANLRKLLSFTGLASVVDPCVGQGTALNLLTQDAEVRRYGVELDAERAQVASAKGIETIQGNAFDAIAKPESFSLLYLNPPYDSEIGPVANSRMERLFLEHTFRWLVMEGGLLDWDADKAVFRAKPSDLTHRFPPGGAAPLGNLLAANGFEFLDQLLQCRQTG